MPFHVKWDDPETRQIILWEFIGQWKMVEYAISLKQVLSMLDEVSHTVTLIMELSQNGHIEPGALRICETTLREMREKPNYADFYFAVSPPQLERLLLEIFDKKFAPTNLHFAETLSEARAKALDMLNKIE